MVSRRSFVKLAWAGFGALGIGSAALVGVELQDDTATETTGNTDTNTDPATAEPDPEPEWDVSEAEKAVHRHTNQKRTVTGHEPLAWRDDVAAAAREYAQKIADAGQVTHTLDGTDPAQRYQRHGITAYNGENAYRTWWDTEMSTDSGIERITTMDEFGESVVQGWFASPGHRDNTLRDNSVAEGIGIERKRRSVYVVQVFTR